MNPTRTSICSLVVTIILSLVGLIAHAAMLDTHEVVLDGDGKLLSRVQPADKAYDRVMFLSWDFLLHRCPLDLATGLKVIFTNSEYEPDTLSGSKVGWPNNPAGKNAMLADSAVLYYPYSGNREVVKLVQELLDHQLAHGITPATFAWAKVPWSTAKAGSIEYGNEDKLEGLGVLEPDKVGELGFHGYLRFFQLTGEARYRDAAIACADALAKHVRDGDAEHSPWPFRVFAETGEEKQPYCDHVVAAIRLFDELIRLKMGNVAAYRTAREQAWAWLMRYPMQTKRWENYFEDMPGTLARNQYNPGQTARYLLEHPQADPQWREHAASLIAWIEQTHGGDEENRVGGATTIERGLQFGARVITEQSVYRYKMASHTARYAAINALYSEATGDAAAKDKAFRSFNWATYMCRDNGVVIEGPAEFALHPGCWFTDGHGDYVRHFMLGLGAFPEWAPADENHLLRSSSVVKTVSYEQDGLRYETFDASATEVFRLAAQPARVLAAGQPLPRCDDLTQPGWTFDTATGVLRLRHDATAQVQILYATASQ